MSVIYKFRCGVHYAEVLIDKDRVIRISSEKTGYRFVIFEKYIEKKDARKLKRLINKMDDLKLDKYIIKEFASKGYVLVSKKIVEEGGNA